MRVGFEEAGVTSTAALPEGYTFLDSHKNSIDKWLDLLNRDGEFGTHTEESVQTEILGSLIPNGAVLIAFDNEIVACASACFVARFRPDALMNYVVVRSDHRRLGLGRAASVEAMNRALQHGYGGMVLQTDDKRDSAITMYLALGFSPVTAGEPDAARRWDEVLARLN